MSTYVVGDIQGCFQELTALLSEVNFAPGADHLWIAGDLINRGPDNLETINFIRQLPNCRMVLGNHDLHFLAVALTDRTPSRSDTFQDILDSAELTEIIQWLRRQPLAFYDKEFDVFVVHAGIPSIWSIPAALTYASEVEAVLQGKEHLNFLSHMYGNDPDQFSNTQKGETRWRTITNTLTRLRFCDAAGKMEFNTKTDTAPLGFAPWFNFPRHDESRILFGHWAAIEGKTSSKQFVALDTGCVWGRELTALRLDDNKLFSISASSGR